MAINAFNAYTLNGLEPPPGHRHAPAARDTIATGADLTDGQTTAEAAQGEDEGLSFWDVLDIINPLQHIPVVSTIYREITGDEIKDAAKIAGGALFGGPIGLAMAGVNYAVKAATGKDVEGHVMAMMGLGEKATANGTAVAEAAKEVDTAAAKAPATAGPQEAAPATAPTNAATETAAPAPRVDGKWFPLNGSDRRDPTMPLGAQAQVEQALRDRQGPAPERAAQAAPTDLRRGSVEVRPTGRPQASSGPASGPATNPTGMLPLGLLQGVEAAPAASTPPAGAQAARPSADAVRRAMQAQGLTPGDHPALAGAQASAAQRAAPPPAANRPTGRASSPAPTETGPVTVPGWFDSAMQKALSAYEKTGRLGAPG